MVSDQLFYENKQRTRVCGLCFKDDSILLVKHNLNGKPFYAPPGGAVEFGESMENALKRELMEETHLLVTASRFQFITEFIKPPLHAIEVFYHITSWEGSPVKGSDPESSGIEIIQEVSFYPASDLTKINRSELHHILHNYNNPEELLKLKGYIMPPKKL